jgi:RimJ/RimL family protein N-acetyltransferase
MPPKLGTGRSSQCQGKLSACAACGQRMRPAWPRHADDPGVDFRLRDRFPHPYAEEDAHKFIAYALSSRKETIYAIETEGQAASTIALMFREGLDYPVAETSYWLGRAWWGRAIVSATVQIMVRHVPLAIAHVVRA